MKLRSKILSSILLVSVNAILLAGVPDEPKQEAPPVIEKPTAEVRAKAEAAVKVSVLDVLKKEQELSHSNWYKKNPFTRAVIISVEYTAVFRETAPEGLAASPDQLAFEVQSALPARFRRKPEDAKITVVLTGYYDAKTNAVQLYHPGSKAYVAAEKHPTLQSKATKN